LSNIHYHAILINTAIIPLISFFILSFFHIFLSSQAEEIPSAFIVRLYESFGGKAKTRLTSPLLVKRVERWVHFTLITCSSANRFISNVDSRRKCSIFSAFSMNIPFCVYKETHVRNQLFITICSTNPVLFYEFYLLHFPLSPSTYLHIYTDYSVGAPFRSSLLNPPLLAQLRNLSSVYE
jgi:hypothetical protein